MPSTPDPIPIHGQAAENLRYIRTAMERAGTFTAVPGWGTIVVGVTAVAAALFAGNDVTAPRWLYSWLAEAFVATVIAAVTIFIKARATSTALTSGPARRFALAFVPALGAGLVLTFIFWRRGLHAEMTPMWLLLYGTAVMAGGAMSVRIVPVMGLAFGLLGFAAFFLPVTALPAAMIVGFGLFHVIFGALIARYHGG